MSQAKLSIGDPVFVRPVGTGAVRRALIVEVFEKSARVEYVDDGSFDLVSRRKITPKGSGQLRLAPSTARKRKVAKPVETVAEHVAPAIQVVSWKSLKPQRSPSYLQLVRSTRCMVCSSRPPNDPHHAGHRGVGQKCSDMLVVPLCRRCHDVVTDTNKLPGSVSAEATKALIEKEQAAQLTAVLARLPRKMQLTVLVSGFAHLEEEELADVLKTMPKSYHHQSSVRCSS